MTTYTKLRELVTLYRGLEAEARLMPRAHAGRADRLIAAEEYRLQAFWLAGRIDSAGLAAGLAECLDARAYPID